MSESSDPRELLLAYRLGDLSRPERDALDERMIADGELSDRLAEAEYDLLDDYHAGRLTAAERSRVERAFSPRELAHITLSVASGAAPSPVPRGRRLPWLTLATGTAFLAVVGGVLFSVHFRNSHVPTSVAHSGTGAPPAQTPSSPTPETGKPPSSKNQPAPAESAAVAILVLEPAITRGELGAVLTLRPSTAEVRVQCVLPAGTSGSSFVLSVTKNGNTLASNLQYGPIQLVNGSRVAEFHLSATVFAGHPANSRFLFVVTEKSTRATVSEYPVVLLGN